MKEYDIYGIGAALVDTEIQVTSNDLNRLNIDKGVMTLVDEARQIELLEELSSQLIASKRASGGSAANTIIAASLFGVSTYYSCLVADDENGHFYLNDLKQARVDYSEQNATQPGTTGKCLVMVTPDADRTMNTFLGISEQLSINDVDSIALERSKYAYIEGYLVTSKTGFPAAKSVCSLAKKFNVKLALSLSDPFIVECFHDNIFELAKFGMDILFCNEAEALSFTKTGTIAEAFELLKKVAKTFAITLGEKGAILWDGEHTINIQGQAVQAIDTNGAGDMFAGAFLSQIIQGRSYRTAGEFACKSASVVVSQFGPRLKSYQHKQLIEEHLSVKTPVA